MSPPAMKLPARNFKFLNQSRLKEEEITGRCQKKIAICLQKHLFRTVFFNRIPDAGETALKVA